MMSWSDPPDDRGRRGGDGDGNVASSSSLRFSVGADNYRRHRDRDEHDPNRAAFTLEPSNFGGVRATASVPFPSASSLFAPSSSAASASTSAAATRTSFWGGRSSGNDNRRVRFSDSAEGEDDLQTSHRKRLATILRYLAAMHRSSSAAGGGGQPTGGENGGFVRTYTGPSKAKRAASVEFFNDATAGSGVGVDEDDGSGGGRSGGGSGAGGAPVVFSLSDFRRASSSSSSSGDAATASTSLFPSPPFSFYAAGASASESQATSSSAAAGGSNSGRLGLSVSWAPGGGGGRRQGRRAGGGGGRKRTADGRLKSGGGGGGGGGNSRWTISTWSSSSRRSAAERAYGSAAAAGGGSSGGDCWLRLTRIKPHDPPSIPSDAVRQYLQTCLDCRKGGGGSGGGGGGRSSSVHRWLRSIHDPDDDLFDLNDPALNHASLTDKKSRRDIKSFLAKYQRHLRRDAVRKALEPSYNALFELAQKTKSADASDVELVWGLGNARMILGCGGTDDDGDVEGGGGGGSTASYTVVNGPILEVRVEVELAPDGALLVRPCEHTGVELNRQVLLTLATGDRRGGGTAAGSDVLADLHRTVADMETKDMSPAQPATFAHLLKRVAVEVRSGGRFVSTKSLNDNKGGPSSSSSNGNNRLLVTDSWCFYHRSRPSSVWARDAQTLAEHVSRSLSWSDPYHRHRDVGGGSPPWAALSLTHGPSALSSSVVPATGGRFASYPLLGALRSILARTAGSSSSVSASSSEVKQQQQQRSRPLFPLPTSDAQNRIHQLLSDGDVPAVVVEGPPGCGKTHTIANILCSYLAQGKRALVTSKGAPALSVLRDRLPECIQELCVDVTVSESAGMVQLQQTVERLANKISCGVDKTHLCESLESAIGQLEKDVADIDEELENRHDRKSATMRSVEGQELTDAAFAVVTEAPWMAVTVKNWSVDKTKRFLQRVESLAEHCHGYGEVDGYISPPPDSLIRGVAAKAGMTLLSLAGGAVKTFAAVPVLGSLSGAKSYLESTENDLQKIRVSGEPPKEACDWKLALQVMRRDKEHWRLHDEEISLLMEREGWPKEAVYKETNDGKLSFNDRFVQVLRMTNRTKEIQQKLFAPNAINDATHSQNLEVQRSKMVAKLQELNGKLVEARVVTQLSRMFSPEAQSALVKFSQLAGKARWKSSAQVSRLSQRQQRHRQEYLKAFEQCVRYIPCWILTTNQVSDYLPAEFGLFDVCIIDEASQSDITALPSMLRGMKWLVVGDGKQVSPTESFVSEGQIDSLRASLPDSPFQGSFLPGHSFFDLCAQAFPVHRVVLNEHFRCAPEIIHFSNVQYYQERLHPLRLPTSIDKIQPSLVDVYVRNGRKIGKVNEAECDKIVEMIEVIVRKCHVEKSRPRSIGIICLVGDEQSRLVRGRLLDAVGPEMFNGHDILVGEPPSFQGSERDIVFLSMVASPGSVPTQSQLMNHQRFNVALSRARDQLVLVRSIGRNHIVSAEDAKLPIIDFFSEYGCKEMNATVASQFESIVRTEDVPVHDSLSTRDRVLEHTSSYLDKEGYATRSMRSVWKGGMCIESNSTGARAAMTVECGGELKEEWAGAISQQRSIERVGWKCLRLDATSWMVDHKKSTNALKCFLTLAGVEKPCSRNDEVGAEHDADETLGAERSIGEGIQEERRQDDGDIEMAEEEPENFNQGRAGLPPDDIIVISSNESEDYDENSSADSNSVAVKQEDDDDDLQPNQYGDVVDLEGFSNACSDSDYLRRRASADSASSNLSDVGEKKAGLDRAEEEDYHGDESEGVDDHKKLPETLDRAKRLRHQRSKRRRLDSYSRDGRWYPGRESDDEEEDDDDAEDEDWEDLKDVVSDTTNGVKNGGEELAKGRTRASFAHANTNVKVGLVGGEERADGDEFHDCVSDQAEMKVESHEEL